jgi:hypothetical protein
MLTGAVLTAGTSAAARLQARGQSVAIAESSTGGLIAAALVAQDGTSRYFRGGFVLYTLESLATQTRRRLRRRLWRAQRDRAGALDGLPTPREPGSQPTGASERPERPGQGPTATAIPPAIVGSQQRGPTGSCPRTCSPATATVSRTWRPSPSGHSGSSLRRRHPTGRPRDASCISGRIRSASSKSRGSPIECKPSRRARHRLVAVSVGV